MEFDKFTSREENGKLDAGAGRPHHRSRATRWCWRSARRTRSPGSSATWASSSTRSGTCRSSTRRRSCRRGRACSSAATRRSARPTSSGRSSTATRRRSRSTSYCQGLPVTERPPHGMTLTSTKMGLHEWAYSNNYDPVAAPEDEARRDAGALLEDDHRGRGGLHGRADARTRSSAASTATCRRTSPTRCASSATPASTSARRTA